MTDAPETRPQRIFIAEKGEYTKGRVNWRQIGPKELVTLLDHQALDFANKFWRPPPEPTRTNPVPTSDKPAPPSPTTLRAEWRKAAKSALNQCRPGQTPPSLLESCLIGVRSDPSNEGQDLTRQLQASLELAKAVWGKKRP